jgi:hypothetical protein
LKAPFPWFGGKRKVAGLVWEAFGADIANFVEPFCGSLAVLLGRPGGAGKIETANDLDGHLVNFWRSIVFQPDEAARWADWPVSELDLHARHAWLVKQIPGLREKLRADPHYCDPQLAGYWCWGICCWIGGGWCAEPDNHKIVRLDGIGKGVNAAGPSGWRKRPQMDARPGCGVHRLPNQLPAMSVTCDGAATGRGVHSGPAVASHRLPALGNDRGLHGVSAAPCVAWFRQLQQRLRRVRFACGDWRRVLGPSILGKGRHVGGRKPCAIFFDPPYDPELRNRGLYSEDHDVAQEVGEWARKHGGDPDLRIALCGYDGEHEMPGWREVSWTGARGYAGDDNDNRSKERIWFSPHCLNARQGELF